MGKVKDFMIEKDRIKHRVKLETELELATYTLEYALHTIEEAEWAEDLDLIMDLKEELQTIIKTLRSK